jgi:hypothetical protein
MLWLFLMLTTLTAEQSVNLMFAALCLGMAAGLNTRLALMMSAVLYLALVLR